jgi:galactose mutarotase-like enzyme
MSTGCRIAPVTLERGVTGLALENDRVQIVVLPGKGADITSMVVKPEEIELLWQSPWGLLPSGGVPTAENSQVAWLDAYQGGWQEIFPSGGGPCHYKGVELNFHGEASTSAWDILRQEAADDFAELTLALRLRRSPFRIERTMRIEAGSGVLRLRERVTNEGGEAMEFMWGHHPAYGAPFLSEHCRIDTNARTVRSDPAFEGPYYPLVPGSLNEWPHVTREGQETDLSRVPGESGQPRQTMAYLGDFSGDHGWYAIRNEELGIGVGLAWPTAIFPFAWFWQEMHGSAGYPWYRGVYTMAIEPFTSWPGSGLAAVIEQSGTQRSLEPGESLEAELLATVFHGRGRVTGISPEGVVSQDTDGSDGE